MPFYAFMPLCVFTSVFAGFCRKMSSVLKLVNIFVFSVLILVDAFGFLVFYFHPDRAITQNLFTVTENILRKKASEPPLGPRRNFIAGTKRAIPSGQYRSILHAWVANHSAGLGSSCPLTELVI